MKNKKRVLLFLPCTVVCACHTTEQREITEYPDDSAFYPAIDDDDTGAAAQDSRSNPWIDGFDQNDAANEPTTTDPSNNSSASGNEDSDPGQGATTSVTGDSAPPNSDDTSDANPIAEAQDIGAAHIVLSEYKEGLGSDKRLALINLGDVTPKTCKIQVYVNGGTSPWREIAVPHQPTPGQGAVVLCSEAEQVAGCSGSMSGSYYNGNDALLVICDDVVMDSFGQIGFDPGAAWIDTNRTVSSKDMDLIRCDDTADLNAFDVFFVQSQWIKREAGEPLEIALLRCPAAISLGGSGNAD